MTYSRGTGRVGDRRLGQELGRSLGFRVEALCSLTRAPGPGRQLAGSVFREMPLFVGGGRP